MKVRILGCSGGIGAGLRTTSLMIDDDILIDAGSGVGDLSHEEMSHIKHIFVTHSHIDHHAFIPLLVDSIFERLVGSPIIVHAHPDTIKMLQKHIFNWDIWPDFTELPSKEKGVLRFEPFSPGETVTIGEREVEMIAVNHIVPSVGYRVACGDASFAFSGDTASNDSFWQALNAHTGLNLLIVETAFPNRQKELAALAKHYCPATLAEDLGKLQHEPEVYLTHLKPGEEMAILSEAKVAIQRFELKALVGGEVFQL